MYTDDTGKVTRNSPMGPLNPLQHNGLTFHQLKICVAMSLCLAR